MVVPAARNCLSFGLKVPSPKLNLALEPYKLIERQPSPRAFDVLQRFGEVQQVNGPCATRKPSGERGGSRVEGSCSTLDPRPSTLSPRPRLCDLRFVLAQRPPDQPAQPA